MLRILLMQIWMPNLFFDNLGFLLIIIFLRDRKNKFWVRFDPMVLLGNKISLIL